MLIWKQCLGNCFFLLLTVFRLLLPLKSLVFLRLSGKTDYLLKVSYFLHKVTCCKLSQYATSVFTWHLHVCNSSLHDSWNAAKRLFQLSGETSCSVTTSVWHGIKKCLFSSSHCFEIGDPRLLLKAPLAMISKHFVRLDILMYYWVR